MGLYKEFTFLTQVNPCPNDIEEILGKLKTSQFK